jgi:hypothetical protein
MATFKNPGNLKFKHAICSELRVRVEGPRPGNMAKVKLTDEMGNPLTQGILHSWSDGTVNLLRELLEAIAQDMVDALEADEEPQRRLPHEREYEDEDHDSDDGMNLGYRE